MKIESKWEVWMRSQGLSERTIAERLETVRRLHLFTSSTPLSLSSDCIQVYMGRPTSAATRATYHATIRAYCAWMQRTGVREDNPADMTPRPRRPKSRPRPVAFGQLEALLNAANRRRTRTYILLGAFGGLRVHEIAKVRGEDIDRFTQTLTVFGKGGKVGVIPLHQLLIDEASHYPSEGYWFPAYSSQSSSAHVTSHAVSRAIHDAMLRAGFRGKPHQLRHFYGTELVRAGVNLRVVQSLMRHESPASTAIYTEVDADLMRAGINLLPARLAA